MSKGDMSALWWEQITGPANMVTQVMNALLGKQHVIIKVPADIPWRHQMRRAIESAIKQRTGSLNLLVQTIDVADECPEEVEIGHYLLRRMASGAISSGFRERSGEPIQSYLSRNDVLKGRIIWVKGMDAKQMNHWRKFCRGYAAKDASDGLFVLECVSGTECACAKNLAIIDYNSYISRYDTQIFNSIVLNKEFRDIDSRWKQYISTVCASLCNTDAEVSYDLIQETDFSRESPLNTLERLSESDSYKHRGIGPANDHVFAHVRQHNVEALTRMIWTAQLQVAFPLIELERVNIIQQWEENFKQAFAFKPVKQYNTEIKDPYEIELGSMDYLMHYKADIGYWLYIPNSQVRNWIHFLHTCRNILAHVNLCDPDKLKRLFAGP